MMKHEIDDTSIPILQDQYGRIKRKLRISVTDRCNFKCIYCMPEHPEWMKKKDLLSFEALFIFCQYMVRQGIENIRITGGEPLMRQGVVHFIRDLQDLRVLGLKRISITTNGHYLAKYAEQLKQAGLDDLNISLDSLDAHQFKQLTKKELAPVLAGIEAARKVGLPFKINCVLMQGQNDDQIVPMVKWAKQQQIPLRFIEFMPLDGDQHWTDQAVVSEAEILKQLSPHYDIQVLAQQHEPARLYQLDDQYQLGIISTITHSFCGDCDRIRLTAQGELYNCLFARQGLNIKPDLLQAIKQKSEFKQVEFHHLEQKIKPYIWNKAQGYHAIQHQQARKISMHMLGG
ncbi:molybdenum cofactor biosynthesis protein A [Acinetobacter sp. ANC 3929]|uniref:GTP 3',8-cyclase MoaA n=1 Tax=unclassified Acinetobacter TaxID=196816 RepID=UPI0002CF9F46|nr:MULTISPECIES: GTP 3',8-cyclase MoaA [unclassified Acinetobacter]ENW81022.1 molybdenum cofactor biosynthesis protein A [Acinetobacter sp. ANC 3929]MCH7351399.1 GTP 3',8-cyclase MoaA [Acinetobacter sp. NIPH 2023]MCH7355545.1 GTP 3',8-cyclase MoaA [Acinetobacter sp. NIPH 1958]MCH7358066.1 GTP 3',8-cyclase MoaA [Acinetobacter sp. NIPH 2024]